LFRGFGFDAAVALIVVFVVALVFVVSWIVAATPTRGLM
jgi:hypothetical protein